MISIFIKMFNDRRTLSNLLTIAILMPDRFRGVAQPGSVLEWGSSGRRFESDRPDHIQQNCVALYLTDVLPCAKREHGCFAQIADRNIEKDTKAARLVK